MQLVFAADTSSSSSKDLLEKLIKNANILEINNITVPGLNSNRIRGIIIIMALLKVSIGLVKVKIIDDFIRSKLFRDNLLINRSIYGFATHKIIIR